MIKKTQNHENLQNQPNHRCHTCNVDGLTGWGRFSGIFRFAARARSKRNLWTLGRTYILEPGSTPMGRNTFHHQSDIFVLSNPTYLFPLANGNGFSEKNISGKKGFLHYADSSSPFNANHTDSFVYFSLSKHQKHQTSNRKNTLDFGNKPQ
jgi:hypothetical protein